MIYHVTNLLLARLYFDSNTQETNKRQVHPLDGVSFCHYMNRTPAKNYESMTVRKVFTCMYFISF